MDHGQGSGAARGSEERQRHRGREDPRSASQKEWSTGKVGVTVASLTLLLTAACFSLCRARFSILGRVRPGRRFRRACYEGLRLSESSGAGSHGRVSLAHSIIEPPLALHVVCSVSTCSDSRLADKVPRCENAPRPTYTVHPVSSFPSRRALRNSREISRLNGLSP